MDPFTIAALVATIAGAGVQYKASSDAAARQQAEVQRSLQSQKKLQQKAEATALEEASQYEGPKRAQAQDELAEQITTELMQPVGESQAIRASQTETQGNVSGDYTAAKAASDLQTVKDAEGLARLLGRTTSAGRLRMNEGIRMMDAGQKIDQLGSFSRGQAGADQIAINAAGQADPGMVLAGSLLQAGGSAGMMYGGSAASTGNAAQGLRAGGGAGLKMGGGTGLKMGSGTGINAAGWF